MSFTEVLAELPVLTVAERQLLVRRALDLDDPVLPAEDVAVVEHVWRIIAKTPVQPCRATK
jgi:hypothetical protein